MNVVLCLSKTDDSSEKITNDPYGQCWTSQVLLSRVKMYQTLPGDNIFSKSNDSLFIKNTTIPERFADWKSHMFYIEEEKQLVGLTIEKHENG